MKARKQIAVNTRFLIKDKLEGIGMFTYESLRHMVASHPEVDFYFLFDRPFSNEFVFARNVTPVVLFPPARHPFLWYWWFEISVARWLNKHQPDLFLSPDGYGCLKTNVPQVLVMHDLAFEHYSNHVGRLALAYYKYFMPRFTQKAKRIATVSEYTKNDIVGKYHITPDVVDVVYNGAKEIYRPLEENIKSEVRKELTSGSEYFLFVSAIHPRKNVANLLLAFDKFRAEVSSDIKLVLAGRKAWDYHEVDWVYEKMQFKKDVIFTGHLPAHQLADVVGAALALVYPSLFEGFGIPIVEAMYADVPVITSNTTSMPEVAGDAALLVDPLDVSAIALAMNRICHNKGLRENLINLGKIQREKFDWKLTAEKLWHSVELALNS